MKYDFVDLSVKDRICTITINKPPVNALNGQTYGELTDAFTSINFREDISVVILCSKGKGFVAGNDINDIKTMTKSSHHHYQDVLCGCALSIMKCRYPVIGAVQGYALGAGLVLASACDIVVASKNAYFGLPEVTLSIVSGSSFLSLMVPDKMVRYMAITGTSITAGEMYKLGGICKVVENDNLMASVMELAEKMALNPPTAMQFSKEAINMNRNAQIERKFLTETLYTDRMLDTPEKIECTNAFFEKRRPRF